MTSYFLNLQPTLTTGTPSTFGQTETMSSLRNKLLTIFLLFSALTTLLILSSSYYFQNKREISEVTDELNSVYLFVLEDLRCQNDFYHKEANNPFYFQNRKSHFLDEHQRIAKEILKRLKRLKSMETVQTFDLGPEVSQMNKVYQDLLQSFAHLEDLFYKKGYKDFGFEGLMRESAHALEDSRHIAREAILNLRRHEKDYIIRKDKNYAEQLIAEVSELDQIVSNSGWNQRTKSEHQRLLKEYKSNFLELVKLDSLLGIHNYTGQMARMDSEAEYLVSQLDAIIAAAKVRQNEIFKAYENRYYLFFGAFIFLSIIGSFFLSKKFTRAIHKLNKQIKIFIESNFTQLTNWDVPSKDEVGQLTQNFKILEIELMEHVRHFQKKVEERTHELEVQKNEVIQHKERIQEQNKEIIDSIRYAERIQRAIFPHPTHLQQQLKEHFLLFQPKDLVSGDFYWTHEVKTADTHRLFLAVSDCTGHGVPGAFMSVLGVNSLNEILNNDPLLLPDQVLHQLNKRIIRALNRQEKIGLRDGMDIALMMIDFKTEKLLFSGAGRNLLYTHKDLVYELHGNRASIAGSIAFENYHFNLQELSLNEIEKAYLYSDGIIDQFGGPKGKKFKKIQLVHLIENLQSLPMEAQGEFIHQALNGWKGDNFQVDDMCLLGLDVQYCFADTVQALRKKAMA